MQRKELENKISNSSRIYLIDNNLDSTLIHSLAEKCAKIDGCIIDIHEDSKLADLKRIYDFSDKISLISHGTNYPSIFNYLKQGLLSEDEVIEALIK